MSAQKAIVLQGEEKVSLVTDRTIPKVRSGYLLVEVKAVALNPTDWKHVDFINTPGSLVGCDYAGIVAETGSGYEKQWKKGDRICGFTNGSNNLQTEDGAFAEYIVVKADVQMHFPEKLPFEEAATFGVAVITCGQSMYQTMGMEWPTKPISDEPPHYFLVYGGSSGMGTFAIQLAKLSGYVPITTCSPRNFELVKSLGAVAAFDYNDPKCAEKIKEYTNNNLKLVLDTIALTETAKICEEAISFGGKYGALLPVKCTQEDVQSSFTLGYTAVGEPVSKPWGDFNDTTGDFEWMKKWIAAVEPLVLEDKIKAHPVILGQGLEGVIEGMDMMRKGKVSAQKLVYTV